MVVDVEVVDHAVDVVHGQVAAAHLDSEVVDV